MSYLWQEFNIKTFPAETLIFRDGIFCDDLSDYESVNFDSENNTIIINKTSKLPIHIIYIGEIAGNIDININLNAKNANVFMTTKINVKKPAFLNIFIKNTGKNSVFNGQIIAQNYNLFNLVVNCEHLYENTGIFVKNRIFAHHNSNTNLTGYAIIGKNIQNCDSDISFSVMADDSAKIKMCPMQYIKSEPKNAKHSASIYKPNENQIEYLRGGGLSTDEIKDILKDAFLEQN